MTITSDPTFVWSKQFGTSLSDTLSGLAVGSNGDVYLAGYTPGKFDKIATAGSTDAFLARYKPDGSQAMLVVFGTEFIDLAYGLEIDPKSGSVFVVGQTEGNLNGQVNSGQSDAFITKFDANGSAQLTRLLGTSKFDSAQAIDVASDGSVYVAGSTSGDFSQPSAGGRISGDVFIAKLNPADLSTEWINTFGSEDLDSVTSIAIGPDNSVYVAGFSLGSLKNVGGKTNQGYSDIYVSRFSPNGDMLWTQVLGTRFYDFARTLLVDDSGIFLAGSTTDRLGEQPYYANGDAFITKLDTSGEIKWVRLFGTVKTDSAYSLAGAGDGAFYVAGTTEGDLNGKSNKTADPGARVGDAFVSQFSTEGVISSTWLEGTTSNDEGIALGIADGALYLAGITGGSLRGQQSFGQNDIFLQKWQVTSSTAESGPTIAITSNKASLKQGETALITFTLSEASSDFTLADITKSGGVLTNFAGSGTSYTATFQPAANSTANGVISVSSGKFSNAAGKFNTDGADGNNTVSITISTVGSQQPTFGADSLSGSSGNDTIDGLAGSDTIRGGVGNDSLLGGADNDALYGDDGDDTLLGGAGDDQLYGGNGTDTATFSSAYSLNTVKALYEGKNGALSGYRIVGPEGTDTLATDVEFLSFESARYELKAGSVIPLNTPPTNPPPTIAISTDKASIKVGETATITFALSAPSADFTESDITVTTGKLSNFSGSGTTYTAIFTPTANGTTNTSISVSSGSFTDAAGVSNSGSAPVTITLLPTVNMVTPTVQFSSDSSSENEGHSGNTTITVQATLSAASTQTVTVPITYSGTATLGSDYDNASTSITIAAGQTTGSASFSVLGDTTVEGNETVVLTLGTPTNATLGQSILRTDEKLDVAIEGAGYFKAVSTEGVIAFTRYGDFKQDSQGQLTTKDDRVIAPGITIPAGSTSVTVSASGEITGSVEGQTKPFGQIQLFSFANPTGLKPIGSNLFVDSIDSGAPTGGVPGSNGLGVLKQGYIEQPGTKTTFIHTIVNDDNVSLTASQPTGAFLSEGNHIALGSSLVNVFGAAGVETVMLSAGTSQVVLDQNVDRVYLSAAPSAYRFKQTGIRLDGYAATGNDPVFSVALQNDADGTVLVFPGGSASAKVSAAGMSLGGATVSASAPAVVSPTLSAYVVPPSGPSTAGVFLGQDANFSAASSGLKIYGAAGGEAVTLTRGVSDITMDQSVERVQFDGLATSALKFQQQGISLLVFDGTTLLAKVPLQTDADGTLITTTNGTMQTKVSAAGMFLGGALVSSAVPSTVIPVEVDSTLKALSDSKELSNQINVAIEGFEPYDASKGDVTFTLSRNSSFPAGYTYTIYGFGAGDKIIGPSELDTRFSNDSFVDGSVTLTYGTFANVTLTGLTAAQDSALFGRSSFNDVFGPATLG